MEFRRLLPPPAAAVEVADQIDDLGLAARARPDRPHLIANFAVTADGRATIDGRSGAIGDDGDMEIFRRLRTQVDALLVGTGTLRAERYGRVVRRPELRAARAARGLAEDPPLATISRSGTLPLGIPLFDDPHSTVLAFTTAAAPDPECAATVVTTRLPREQLTPATVLARLRRDHGVRSVLCEGGPRLMAALLRARLVDELFLTVAPQLAGGGDGPTITQGPPLAAPASGELLWALERNGSLYLRYGLRSDGHRETDEPSPGADRTR